MTTTDTTQARTPLPASSIVYQYRALSWCDGRWLDIKTQDELDQVKARPDVYKLRALSVVSLDDLLRAPIATVGAALAVIDQARRDRDAIAGKLRAALAALGDMP